MPYYRLSGHEVFFQYHLSGLNGFKITDEVSVEFETLQPRSKSVLLSRNVGIVARESRQIDVWSVPPGFLLKVSGGSDFYITSGSKAILRVGEVQGYANQDKIQSSATLSGLDREILLGPALVLALALRDIWSLHASAAMFAETVIVFLGESGQGKSTLAAYLSGNSDWRLVADDILPIRMDADRVHVLPHFPQLKLPIETQPGTGLPEHLPLTKLCVLTPAAQDTMPEVQVLPPTLAIQALLSHTAGTRMFTPEMLGKHLSFCSLVAGQVPVYHLSYPHREDALPEIKELLENLC
jgi:hypothetical protein